jgi:sugar phosphate isomerase/epimerase
VQYAFMTFSTPELSLDRVCAVAAEYGYDGVELRLDAGHGHGVEVAAPAAERERLAAVPAEHGVALAALASSLRFADPAQAGEVLAAGRERIALAAAVGAPCLRVFGGGIPEGIDRNKAVGTVADGLGALADAAGEAGVVLCLETHDDWCDPRHVADVLTKVDHPAVAANWDIMHPVRTGAATIEESFRALRPWIRHVHLHDGRTTDGELQLLPIGEGEIDHRQALALLLAEGYGGFLSGEWIGWEPWETHLPRELATLRRYETELTGETG